MSQSLPNPRVQSPLETVQPVMAKAQRLPKPLDLPEEAVSDVVMLSLIATARRRSDLKLEYLASLCGPTGVALSTLSGALNGHGSFNVCWLTRWPPAFWNEYLPLLRAEKEQSPEAVAAQRREHLIRAIELLLAGAA